MEKVNVGDIVKARFGTVVYTYTENGKQGHFNHSIYGIVTGKTPNQEAGKDELDVAFVVDGSSHRYKEEDLEVIGSTGLTNTVQEKVTLEQIKKEYHSNSLCMGELLASFSADGLNLEEAFALYIQAKKWADGDCFFRVINDNEAPEEL